MSQFSKSDRGKNLILISNPSEPFNDSEVPNFFSRGSSLGNNFQRLQSSGFDRQQSVGNLFKTFNKDERQREESKEPTKKEEPVTDAHRYAQQCLEYEKYQFDDRIRLIIHRISIKAYHSFRDRSEHKFLSFFVEKLLCVVAKKLLLNRFELLFLEYVFEETKWRYDIDCIQKKVNEFEVFTNSADSNIEASKSLQIYLLYCSYYSKKSLNEVNSVNIFSGFLKSLCPRFKDNFQEWTVPSTVSNIKINPKVLNHIFKSLTFYSGPSEEEIENYNLLVEEIIDISPAYSAGKGGKKKNKKVKKEERSIPDPRPEPSRDPEPPHGDRDAESDMLINQMPLGSIQHDESDLNEIPYLRNRKHTSYVSNVDDLDPELYARGSHHQRMI